MLGQWKRFGRLVCALLGVLASCGPGASDPPEEGVLSEQRDALLLGCIPTSTVHCGNVSILGQAEADLYQGILTFVGNVTIKGGQVLTMTGSNGEQYWAPNLVFSMPSLKNVSGNLSIDGDRMATVSLPNLRRVNGNLTVTLHHFLTALPVNTHAVTALDTPVFTQLGGNLSLIATRGPEVPSGATAHNYDFGLDTLTTALADINVTNDTLPSNISGVGGLTTVHGNLTINWRNSDMFSTGLLENVTTVQGDLHLIAPINSRSLMPALETIGGGLEITPAGTKVLLQQAKVFENLASIGGSVHLVRTAASNCHGELPALEQVGGTIVIDNTTMQGHFGKTGVEHLVAGGIEIRAGSQGPIPFFMDLQLTPAATVSIHDNASLCPCTIQTFAPPLAAAGWAGSVSSVNNGIPFFCSICPTCP